MGQLNRKRRTNRLTKTKDSIRLRRKVAAWDDECLARLVTARIFFSRFPWRASNPQTRLRLLEFYAASIRRAQRESAIKAYDMLAGDSCSGLEVMLADKRKALTGESMKRAITLAAFSTLMSACTNLQAVNTASGSLVAASSSWNTIADDWAASCHRRSQVSTAPSDCAQEKKATDGLEATDKVLAAYFTALQQVSDTENFNVDAPIATLSTSVSAIPTISSAQVTTVTTFGAFLADLATGAIRERTIGKLITDGAPKAIATIEVLHSVVVPQLKIVYDAETGDTDAAFRTYILGMGTHFDTNTVDCVNGPSANSFPQGDAFLLALEYCRRSQAIATKRLALDSYDKSLISAQSTLRQLVDGKDKLRDGAIIMSLLNNASALNDNVSALKKAF